ncbi:hypothetical protein [Haladaptatus sp. W1]|uniref:hypothetical protein n=1 Tax=Haladaptatus sp. W1 TaxID=1897478 RepID=UPI0011130246|nr:hypothetical protein [Haladaptatus sp. W1]
MSTNTDVDETATAPYHTTCLPNRLLRVRSVVPRVIASRPQPTAGRGPSAARASVAGRYGAVEFPQWRALMGGEASGAVGRTTP